MERYVPLLLFAILAAAPLVAAWIIALQDVLHRPDEAFPPLALMVAPRAFWTFVVICMNVTGALFYLYSVMRVRPSRPVG